MHSPEDGGQTGCDHSCAEPVGKAGAGETSQMRTALLAGGLIPDQVWLYSRWQCLREGVRFSRLLPQMPAGVYFSSARTPAGSGWPVPPWRSGLLQDLGTRQVGGFCSKVCVQDTRARGREVFRRNVQAGDRCLETRLQGAQFGTFATDETQGRIHVLSASVALLKDVTSRSDTLRSVEAVTPVAPRAVVVVALAL